MINKIKNWYNQRKRKKYFIEWINGYDWAAGVLLRKEETPLSIEMKYGYDGTSFDDGVCSAIDKLLELKVIDDDKGD